MRLSFLPTIPHPEPLKEARQRDRLVEGKRDEGMDGLPMPLFGNAMNAWDVKLGNVGLGRKISCHV
jgi:hypothetical protein